MDLRDAASAKPVASQVTKSGKGVTLTWLTNALKAGATQKLVAVPRAEKDTKTMVSVEDLSSDGKVEVTIGGKPFTSYHYAHKWVRPFLYPVIGPYGTQVTRNWPIVEGVKGEHTDHVHHKSIWVAYGECGRVDNWSEEEGHGWQRHRAFTNLVSGPVFGQITAKNDWNTHTDRKQFEEVRAMRFFALPGGDRLFDVDVTFRMTEGPIVFRDTKEGGLVSVRVASSMDVRNGGTIQNGYGGMNEDETWGKHAPWCDYSGMVGGKHVGVAIMDHETNPRYPTQWHVRDYGLMTANCFASKYYRPEAKLKGDMTFKKGAVTSWRYRLYIHKGNADSGKVAGRFHDYVAPPQVALV
ncbi:MAG: hypothetical protein GWP08_20705 [Nitrospiraceae bacterium]|nr:hypothetical protein [Nitrospiraceae bacterium]